MCCLQLDINTIDVRFHSATFRASIELCNVHVSSCTPVWQESADLNQTRLWGPDDGGQVLLFKQMQWETTRIEASACLTAVSPVGADCHDESEGTGSHAHHPIMTPLRLIANTSRIRMGNKKRLSGILSCELTFFSFIIEGHIASFFNLFSQ